LLGHARDSLTQHASAAGYNDPFAPKCHKRP